GLGAAGAFPRSGTTGLVVNALGQYFGSVPQLTAILQPLLTAVPPATQQITSGTYSDATQFLAATTPLDYYAVKSAYARGALSSTTIDALIAQMLRWPGSSNPDGG